MFPASSMKPSRTGLRGYQIWRSPSREATIPPIRHRRFISRIALTGSERWTRHWWVKMTSNEWSGNGKPSRMLPVWKLMFCKSTAAALALACSSTAGETSTPSTDPCGTSWARPQVIDPGPQPTSSIRMCGCKWSTRNLAEFATVRPSYARVVPFP